MTTNRSYTSAQFISAMRNGKVLRAEDEFGHHTLEQGSKAGQFKVDGGKEYPYRFVWGWLANDLYLYADEVE